MNPPRIVILDDWERALPRLADWQRVRALADLQILHEPVRGDELLAVLRDADVVVLMRDRTPMDADLLAKLRHLRLLAFTGTRNNRLDLAALRSRGIPVSHTEWGPSKDSTCEMTWSLILGAVRRLPAQVALLRDGRWRPARAEPLFGVLGGERLGLIGLGQIGARVARVGRAFGMEVVTWSPHMTPQRAAEHGAVAVSLETLLATSKVVSLHLVPSAPTRRLLDAGRLAAMRTDSILVNTSRAELIDAVALADALRLGRPGAAALDVFDTEPLPADDPLRSAPNLMLTPHLGFVAEPVFAQFARDLSEGLEAWLRDGTVLRPVTD